MVDDAKIDVVANPMKQDASTVGTELPYADSIGSRLKLLQKRVYVLIERPWCFLAVG